MSTRDHLNLKQLLLAYLFAYWHVRRMPVADAQQRQRRAVWCRDHCNTFTERWYAMGVAAWFLQISPLGFAFMIGEFPPLAVFFLAAFAVGTWHLTWQIAAQRKAGLPPIDPPVPMGELRRRGPWVKPPSRGDDE